MNHQARNIYKNVESENICNIDTKKKQKIKAEKLDNNNDKRNPYHAKITNKTKKNNTMLSQMEQSSILSNVVNYVQ